MIHRPRRDRTRLGLPFGVKVGEMDMAYPLDVDNGTSIFIDDSSYVRRHQSQSVTDGNTTLPDQPLRASGNQIVVNTAQPTVTAVYGLNGNGEWGWVTRPSSPLEPPVTQAEEKPSLPLRV